MLAQDQHRQAGYNNTEKQKRDAEEQGMFPVPASPALLSHVRQPEASLTPGLQHTHRITYCPVGLILSCVILNADAALAYLARVRARCMQTARHILGWLNACTLMTATHNALGHVLAQTYYAGGHAHMRYPEAETVAHHAGLCSELRPQSSNCHFRARQSET